MGRIRTIKPEFWTDEELSELPPETHLLAAALLNYADDEGYFNANPKLVKAACAPLREDSVSAQQSLEQLSRAGYIRLGVATDGKCYGWVSGFDKHQRVNRPTPSKIKGLSIDWDASLKAHGGISEDSPPEGNREQGKEGKGEEASSLRSEACAELRDSSPPTPAAISPADGDDAEAEADGEVFIELPLNDGRRYPVTERYVSEQQQRFPAVDVHQALREMQGWLDANPRKRKTRTGIKAFVTSWLGREQNRGGNVRPLRGEGGNGTGIHRRGGFNQTDSDDDIRAAGFKTVDDITREWGRKREG